MNLMPILSTLGRHKTASLLIVFEIALTSAIVCNALHLIAGRIAILTRETGLPISELVAINVRPVGTAAAAEDISMQDLAQLRALPGVKSATLVNQIPYGNNNNYTGISYEPTRRTREMNKPVNLYAGGEQVLQTLGLQLVEGRDFKAEEYLSGAKIFGEEAPVIGQTIINRELARKLKPDGSSPLGMPLYVFGPAPTVVVGVVDKLEQSNPGKSADSAGAAMLIPVRPTFRGGAYLLRVDPAQRDAVIKAAGAAIERIDSTRIVTDNKPLAEFRDNYYAQDRSMAWLLVAVCAALLTVTAFGIVGLASFWVEQRTRMIGTRRALGATRGQILRYFQAENFLLTATGVVFGTVGAYAIGLLLMQSYELPRLPWVYLAAGAPVLFALGQLAVLAPARRAAALPPVAALRA